MMGFEAYEMMIGFVIMNAAIIAGIFFVFRNLRRKQGNNAKPSPLNILDERLARGEINQPEYDELRHTLAHG